MSSKSTFLGWIFRMRFIKRWNRMDARTSTDIDLHSHCLNVSVVTHLLAEIDNTIFGANRNAEKLAMMGLYHECAEIFTGDLSNPIKYASATITREIKNLEDEAERMCVNALPIELQEKMSQLIIQRNISTEDKALVKAADDLVALSKAKEEVLHANNVDFLDAMENIQGKVDVHAKTLPAVAWFLDNFTEGHAKTIDQLMKGGK
jgi:5'-deoxynucleotidase